MDLASAGELSTLEIAEDGLARLLDASILLGKPGAAAKIVDLFPQAWRTLRFWSWRDLGWSDLMCPDVIMAALLAGADFASFRHPSNCVAAALFELAVTGGHAQLAHIMMEKSTMPLPLTRRATGLV